MSKSPNDLEILKARLQAFEKNLSSLLKSTEEDLEIAAALQKALMPNRVPEIVGIKVFAKFISAKQLSAESFDIIPTRDQRNLWVISSWTERHGLSSLLLQVLVHLQSVALVESHSSMSVADVFNDLSLALTQTQKTGHYSLRVLKLDLANLKLQGLAVGMGPLLRKKLELSHYSSFEMIQPEALMQNPLLLQKAFSANPTLAADAYSVNCTVEPGTRLYIMGREWNAPAGDLQSLMAPLALHTAPQDAQDAHADLNHLLFKANEHRKKLGLETDLTGISLEIDPRKLHLA